MKDWKDITLRQFNTIQEILETPDDYTTLNIIDIIYGEDTANLPITQYMQKYANALDFLMTPIPQVELKNSYTLNDTVYDSNINLSTLTTAQFVDYQNYAKKSPILTNEILSVFIIPQGHSYNDGYDLEKVKEDLLDLDMATINTLAFFFKKLYLLLLDVFLTSLTYQVKSMKITEREKENLYHQLNQIDLQRLDSYLTLSHFAKTLTTH